MTETVQETIFALSSGKGRAGVSVIRLSGPDTLAAIEKLVGRQDTPIPREARLCWFADPESGHRLDRGILLYFPGPKSFTGEDVGEFHLHGGRAVISGFFAALLKIPGLRPALPGEFTRRAFDNGKMDLTAAEGLADLINAETEAQKRQALRLMEGRLADLYEGWRREIIAAMARVEADIDFADEDIPQDVTAAVFQSIDQLRQNITDHIGAGFRGERIRDGLQVVIIGEPNVGKSTLLNFLSQRDVAIVTDIAGTTRDMLEVHLDIEGFPVTVVDTAGLRESRDIIEQEGIRRAEQRARTADITIAMIDAADWPDISEKLRDKINKDTIILLNKSDLCLPPEKELSCSQLACLAVMPISLKQEKGTGALLSRLSREVEARMELAEAPNLTRERHRQLLVTSLYHLDRFIDSPDKELALLAEDLRMAARALGTITGRVDVEDILEVIFSEFCIGK